MKTSGEPFTRDELTIINNTLNEILNGIELAEFETRIGYTRKQVEKVLKKVTKQLMKDN